MRFDVSHGLDAAPVAYGKLFSGANIGKVLVDLRNG